MIYILKFSEPISHAKYYMGYCADGRLKQRIAEHKRGEGARLTQVAVERGISFEVVVTMKGSRADERRLKNQKNTPRIVRKLLKL